MTTYIASYDTEQVGCLQAVRRIVEVHEKHAMPATFFMVAELLEEQGAAYRELLGGHPLFEVASHTCTHLLLRDHRVCGKAGPSAQYQYEIVESKKRIEDLFEMPVTGFRPPVCFSNGLCNAPHLLELCSKAGYVYTSSLAWGPGDSLPALIRDRFSYEEDGYPDLLELPACGWHENLLKECNGNPVLPMQLFPHPMPEAMVAGHIQSPADEVAINRVFIDKAMEQQVGHVSLIWHPWSLHTFDPAMQMLDSTFNYVKSVGLEADTFTGYARTVPAQRLVTA